MKKILLFIITIVFVSSLFFLTSCCCKKKAAAQNPAPTEVKRDFEKEGYVKATVIFYEVDACKYLLQLEPELNGPDVLKRLEPTILKEEFKKDHLLVWIKYIPKKGGVSICMAGQMVDLTDILLRN